MEHFLIQIHCTQNIMLSIIFLWLLVLKMFFMFISLDVWEDRGEDIIYRLKFDLIVLLHDSLTTDTSFYN